MKKYTIDQYAKMAEKFNAMTFDKQIDTLAKNKDVLVLGVDHEWRIKLADESDELFDALGEADIVFRFKIQEDHISRTTEHLLSRLGVKITDLWTDT